MEIPNNPILPISMGITQGDYSLGYWSSVLITSV